MFNELFVTSSDINKHPHRTLGEFFSSALWDKTPILISQGDRSQALLRVLGVRDVVSFVGWALGLSPVVRFLRLEMKSFAVKVPVDRFN